MLHKILNLDFVAFDEFTLSQKGVYKRYKYFAEGRKDVDNNECPGVQCTSTSKENIETVKKNSFGKSRMLACQSAHATFFGCFENKNVVSKFVPNKWLKQYEVCSKQMALQFISIPKTEETKEWQVFATINDIQLEKRIAEVFRRLKKALP